jgi:meso-butanediol dehydrogenase / (S,S)-butanediol dehydrogenase / diacetyl reductase
MGRLSGKVTVITGAGTGIGRATMELFAREGAKVVGTSRRLEKLEETLQLVKQAGGEGAVIDADVGKPETADRVIALAVEKFGGLDILVNNAGIGWNTRGLGLMEAVEHLTPEAWHEALSSDLSSVFYFSRRAIPEMRKRGGGSIVSVSSVVASQGLMDAHAYCVAKGGILSLTRTMALTYAKEKIRVNAVSPGFTDTPLIEGALDVHDPKIQPDLSAMNRAATPMEIAHAILFFASDECPFCTGAELKVDGGQSLRFFR